MCQHRTKRVVRRLNPGQRTWCQHWCISKLPMKPGMQSKRPMLLSQHHEPHLCMSFTRWHCRKIATRGTRTGITSRSLIRGLVFINARAAISCRLCGCVRNTSQALARVGTSEAGSRVFANGLALRSRFLSGCTEAKCSSSAGRDVSLLWLILKSLQQDSMGLD